LDKRATRVRSRRPSRCWPCKSNSVCLSSSSRALDARWRPSGFQPQAGPFSWFADYPAASSHFCDRHIDAQIGHAVALETTDPYLANQLWAQVDREIVNQAPVVPLFTLKNVDIVSQRVGNYEYNPQWGVLVDQLWVR
jgi:ABC-type transport system substrate-binding protein